MYVSSPWGKEKFRNRLLLPIQSIIRAHCIRGKLRSWRELKDLKYDDGTRNRICWWNTKYVDKTYRLEIILHSSYKSCSIFWCIHTERYISIDIDYFCFRDLMVDRAKCKCFVIDDSCPWIIDALRNNGSVDTDDGTRITIRADSLVSTTFIWTARSFPASVVEWHMLQVYLHASIALWMILVHELRCLMK